MSYPAKRTVDFQVLADDRSNQQPIEINSLMIAGWAGRDQDALEKHIAELEREGIPRPAQTPQFFRVGVNLLTTEAAIQVPGKSSSGEIEAFVLMADDQVWLGAGSDHTDRELETVSIVMSKQACPKPIANILWRYTDIESHWDELTVRSYRYEGQERVLYQEGSLSQNLQARELIDRLKKAGGTFENGTLMFCGTVPTQEGIEFSDRFDMELYDPVLERRINHTYQIIPLPVD